MSKSSESGEVLKVSEVKSAEGRHPSQIVLRQIKPRTYATHIKVLHPEMEPYFILGHYFFDLKDAKDDFHKRILELEGPQPGKSR